MRPELVVPAERAARLLPESGFSGGNDRAGSAARSASARHAGVVVWTLFFQVEIDPVEHVGKRFRMHQAVFNSDAKDLCMRGVGKIGDTEKTVNRSPNLVPVRPNLFNLRPVRRLVVGQLTIHGSMPKANNLSNPELNEGLWKAHVPIMFQSNASKC